jgi:hypothetical protein
MRNVVMAAMLVAAGVSSSYVTRTGGSDSADQGAAKGRTPLFEGILPQPVDDPLDLLKEFLNPYYDPPATVIGSCEDPIDRLRDLLNSGRRPCAPQEAQKPKKTAGINCKASRELTNTNLGLNFIIATVPDPERTHLGLGFDRIIETIIQAAEDENFSYDRHWLPWHVSHDPANPDPLKQDILDGRTEERHRKPGIIILRKASKVSANQETQENDPRRASEKSLSESRNEALVIFLVGETPTEGINRRQFKKAIEHINTFEGCGYTLGVLGPTFSGSATSLRAAILKDFPDQPGGALVISGSASGFDAMAGLGNTTIHSDAFLLDALGTFLGTHLHLRGGVAYLKEAATDFGEIALGPSNPADTTIFYPREISRLRNVHPEQTSSASAEVASLQQQLSLRLRDSRPGEETLPEFSDQTPLTQETVLLQISETLRRDHVGLAIITGTDVLDVLFLSRHLRELSPDVRLLIWDSDLLFVHGTDTLDFSGMLALSTYPLIPANHIWSDPPHSSPYYYFASNMSEGIYNACRLLLNPQGVGLREYAPPTSSGGTRPAVWLSVIGQDAYWPLAFIGDYRKKDALMMEGKTEKPGSLDPGWPTRAWSFVFYFSSLFALVYVGIYFYLLWHLPHFGCLPRWCSLLHPRPYSSPPSWRADYSLLLSLGALLTYLTIFLPVARLGPVDQRSAWHLMFGAGAVVVVGLFFSVAAGLRRIPTWLLLTSGVAASVAMFFMLFPSTAENFFRALRSVQLGSGVDPYLPLFFLFLAFAWWASIEMQRARLVAEHRPEVPDCAGNQAATNIARLNLWLSQGLLHVDLSGWIIALIAITVTSMAAIPHIRSVDGELFDWLTCALVILLATLIFLRTYSFLRLWRTLHQYLEALELRPIRFAFSNLPNDVSWSPLWQYGARRKSYTLLIRSLESLGALQQCSADYYAGLKGELSALEYYTSEIMTQVNQGREEDIWMTEELQALLAQITRNLATALETKGWNARSSETIAKMEKACDASTLRKGSASWFGFGQPVAFELKTAHSNLEPQDKPDILAAEVVALRYLAFIRYIMRHLRNILSFITTGFILMTVALNCYPFQTLNLIRWSITFVFAVVSVVLLYAFQEMSRNEILSRITNTEAGSLDKDFYARVISVGALPVLAVVASHFPSVGRFLFSWVQPAISALH